MKVKKTSLLKSASMFSGMTFLSRILGFVRDIVVASIFGAGPLVDAFFVAFKIPNFMRRLVAEGAFTQAFVPLLTEYQQNRSEVETRKFIGVVAGTLASASFIIVLVGVIFVPYIVNIFAPGFSMDDSPERYQYATSFLRVTFPYLWFISLTAFCGAVMNAYGYFGAPAFAPVWLNVSMIGGALYLSGWFDIGIYGLVWSVLLAGLLQFLFLLPYLVRFNLISGIKINWYSKDVSNILKAMLPALFGVSIAQLNLMMDTIFASFLVDGSVSWLYFSDRLMNFPLGILGVAISTVALPKLSRSFVDGNSKEYSGIIHWATVTTFLIGIPAAIGLIMLSKPIIITLFQRGMFFIDDSIMTSKSLVMFSLGLPAFMMVKSLASALYAQKDYRTPVKVGFISLLVNLILNIILIKPLQHAGLALSTSVAAYVNAALLFMFLARTTIYNHDKESLLFFGKIIIASICMISYIYFFTLEWTAYISLDGISRILELSKVITIASIVYFLSLYILGFRFQQLKGPIS